MNVLHIMVGIQGSGKSTYSEKLAKDLKIKIVSTDIVRVENPGIDEALVWPTVYKMCADELKTKDVIFDATSITPKVRKRLLDNIKELNTEFNAGCYFFDVPLEVCKKRVEYRNTLNTGINIPLEVLDSYQSWIVKPTLDEGFIFVKVVDENGKCTEN